MGKKGGQTTVSSQQNTYDPVYTAKMADIAEREQQMAEEQWSMYKNYFQDYEIAAAKTNKELLPYISEASRLTLEEETRDISANQPIKDALRAQQLKETEFAGKSLDVAGKELDYLSEGIGLARPVQEKFYKESLSGVDVGRRQDQAAGDVVTALQGAEGTRKRELSRMGLNPASSAYRDSIRAGGVEGARMIGGARTLARETGEQENYNRLAGAIGLRDSAAAGRSATGLAGVQSTQGQNQTYFGTADPYARAAGTMANAGSGYSSLANRVISSTRSETTPGKGAGDFFGQLVGLGVGAMTGGMGTGLGTAAAKYITG